MPLPPLCVVLPPDDVQRTRPLEAWRPVPRQMVKPQIADLQQRDSVNPQAGERCHRRQEARPVRRHRRGTAGDATPAATEPCVSESGT